MAVTKRTRYEVLKRDNYACDCNAGKSSTSPDSATVADVASDALRWRKALEFAAQEQRQEVALMDAHASTFRERWNRWRTQGGKGDPIPLPADWRQTVLGFIGSGLTQDDLDPLIDEVMTSWGVQNEFRLLAYKANGIIEHRWNLARQAISKGVI